MDWLYKRDEVRRTVLSEQGRGGDGYLLYLFKDTKYVTIL